MVSAAQEAWENPAVAARAAPETWVATAVEEAVEASQTAGAAVHFASPTKPPQLASRSLQAFPPGGGHTGQ